MSPYHARRVVPELSHLEGVAVRVIPFNDVATEAAQQLDHRFHLLVRLSSPRLSDTCCSVSCLRIP